MQRSHLHYGVTAAATETGVLREEHSALNAWHHSGLTALPACCGPPILRAWATASFTDHLDVQLAQLMMNVQQQGVC